MMVNVLNGADARGCDFSALDDGIHELAACILFSKWSSEFALNRDKYAYRVRGGGGGYLYYRKTGSDSWTLIAKWCFYGLYIVVYYRKAIWLRPMYRSLFAKMNFVSVNFFEHSIELVGAEGEILRSRRFRLTPPSALTKVMAREFGYSEEKIETLRSTLNL